MGWVNLRARAAFSPIHLMGFMRKSLETYMFDYKENTRLSKSLMEIDWNFTDCANWSLGLASHIFAMCVLGNQPYTLKKSWSSSFKNECSVIYERHILKLVLLFIFHLYSNILYLILILSLWNFISFLN